MPRVLSWLPIIFFVRVLLTAAFDLEICVDRYDSFCIFCLLFLGLLLLRSLSCLLFHLDVSAAYYSCCVYVVGGVYLLLCFYSISSLLVFGVILGYVFGFVSLFVVLPSGHWRFYLHVFQIVVDQCL